MNVRFAILFFCLLNVINNSANGQHDLRETLDRMDRNQNQYLDPEEITTFSRAYLEQVSNSGSSRTRLDLDKPIPITYLMRAIQAYQAVRNGANSVRVQVENERKFGVQPFGTREEEPMIPGFGFGELRYQYAQADLDFADRTMRTHDENKDGFIDLKEAARHEWTHREPFYDDLNNDNRLSRLEMAQRYARRRLLEKSSGNLYKQAWRKGEFREKNEKKQGKRSEEDRSMWWRSGGSDYWLAASLMGRFDYNKNGTLEKNEIKDVGVPTVFLDADKDNVVTRDELFIYLKGVQDKAGGSAEGPPDWFNELDVDGDGQLTIPEFAEELSQQRMREFEAQDTNGDGLLTASEVTGAKQILGTGYSSQEGALLPPRKSIVSEIEITDDFPITELKIQILVTHTYISKLDGYLTGPDGQRIELFTAVGGKDDHFKNTVFADDAEETIAKGKPPFSDTFRPEGLDKDLPGLNHFVGKSAKGTWQLIIRGTRNDRFGILHHWTIYTKGK